MTATATISGGSNFSSGRSMSANATRFMAGGSSCHMAAADATEANVQLITRTAGDYSRIGIRVITADTTAAATYRLRKDTGGGGANGNNAATLTTNTTGWFQDAVPHTDTVAAGDKICMAISASGVSSAIVYTTSSMKFLASSGAATYYGVYAPDSVGTYTVTSSTSVIRTYSIPLSGGNGGLQGPNTEAANQRQKMRTPGVISHLHTRITGSNAITNASTFLYRFNNTDGNNAASITASTTGTFEDTTHSDTVNASDVSCLSWRAAIEGTAHSMAGPRSGFAMFVPSVSGFDLFCANSTSSDLSGSAAAANYYTVYGNSTRHTTEANAKTKIPLAVALGFLRCYVAVSQVGALTFALRVNGSTVNQTKSLTSATTGIFEDSVNVDSIVDNDDINYTHGAMVSTSGFWISWLGMTADPGSGITPGNTSQVHHYNSVILG